MENVKTPETGRSIKDIIHKRRSVRTFEQKPLSEETLQDLRQMAARAENPFGVPVEFRLLRAAEHDLSSPVIVGAEYYMAAKVSRAPHCEAAFGYSFERFCLSAAEKGIGTVILAGTLSRETFEAAMDLGDNEIMPTATPVGVAAAKMSLREKMMRATLSADRRLPFESLFFDEDIRTPLTPERAGRYADALQMLRLSPSAINRQPWRAIVCGGAVHFYKVANKWMSDGKFDVQNVDMGIALCHFDLTLREQGVRGEFCFEDPGLADGTLAYIATYRPRDPE